MPLVALLCLLLAGCASAPDWYKIPPQQTAPDPDSHPGAFDEFFRSADMGADAFLVKDVQGAEGDMRWTHAAPEFRFFVASPEHRRFRLDFSINDRTFQATGPVTLVFEINGHELAREIYASPGRRVFEKPVPPEWLKTGEANRVVVRVRNPWQPPDNPKVQLGFILFGAGFAR